jgi:vancomycin resistance protein YoaR
MRKKLVKIIKKLWGRRGIKWVVGIGVTVGIVGMGVVSYHLAYSQKIYPKVRVGNIDLSNLTISEAEGRLVRYLPERLGKIELYYAKQSWPVDLIEMKVAYDVPETAKEAYLQGRGEGMMADLTTKWKLWRQGQDLGLEFDHSEEKLGEIIELVVSQVEEPVIMPMLELGEDNQVRLMPGKNGRLVEKEQLRQTILENIGYLDFKEVEIPTRISEVKINGESLEKTQARAEKLKDKELILKYDSGQRRLKGQGVLDLIDFQEGFDEEKIASLSMNLAEEINRPAQNAVFQFDGQRVREFKPALQGLKLDEEQARREIKAGLERLGSKESPMAEMVKEEVDKTEIIELVVMTSEPEIKTEEVNDLGIKELLGKGESTFHGSIASREHNIALTAAKLNGILLAPGEVFSFNKSLGDVSATTGYKQAYIIKGGRTVLGDGGGVCQVSTTFFRAALNAGLAIVERRAHAYRVAYYEQNSAAGIDATVYDPSPDFQFKNDTPGHILIQTYANTGTNYLKIEIYGTNDGRVATISNTRIWGQLPPPEPLYQDDPTLPAGVVKQIDWAAWGAKTAFDWKVVRGGEMLQERTFYSSFRPWQAVFLRGTGG